MKYRAPLASCIRFNLSALQAEQTIAVSKTIDAHLLKSYPGRLTSLASSETIFLHDRDLCLAPFVEKVFAKAITMLQAQLCEVESLGARHSVNIVW